MERLKLLHIALSLGLLSTVAVSIPASAAHCCGPCTHEWAEIGLHAYDAYKHGGATAAVKTAGSEASACARQGDGGIVLGIVCRLIDCT